MLGYAFCLLVIVAHDDLALCNAAVSVDEVRIIARFGYAGVVRGMRNQSRISAPLCALLGPSQNRIAHLAKRKRICFLA